MMMIAESFSATIQLNESKTAFQLDREIHRLAALCLLYGYDVSRIRNDGDVDVLPAVARRTQPVWISFNDKARLWQRATGIQWVNKASKPWFDEGKLIAWYRENAPKFLVDHVNGKMIDDYMREKARVSERGMSRAGHWIVGV